MLLVAKAALLSTLHAFYIINIPAVLGERDSKRFYTLESAESSDCDDDRLQAPKSQQSSEHCDILYNESNMFLVASNAACSGAIGAAVNKFCDDLERLAPIYTLLYGRQLRCRSADAWDSTTLESLPAFKTVSGNSVRTNSSDWDSMSHEVKRSQAPIVQYLDITTMKFNIDMPGRRKQDHACVASEAERKWGLSPEMQDRHRQSSCTAWQTQQQIMAKPENVRPSEAMVAYNFCWLLGLSGFTWRSAHGTDNFDFGCVRHPNNAFRLVASINGFSKISTTYVHEVLKKYGSFNMSFCNEGEEYLGPIWYLWGSIDATKTTVTLRKLTWKAIHKTPPTEIVAKNATSNAVVEASIDRLSWSAERMLMHRLDQARKDYALQLQRSDVDLWGDRCPPLNKEYAMHPCAYEMALWLADFCTTFNAGFEIPEHAHPENKLALQCTARGGALRWYSMELVTLPRRPETGQLDYPGKDLMFTYVDISRQTLNIPVKFHQTFRSCMYVSLPNRTAVHWRDDNQTLVYSN